MDSRHANDDRRRRDRSDDFVEREPASTESLPDDFETTVNPNIMNDRFAIESHQDPVLARYEYDLAQKDELITVLIQELEQAVEQLDRQRRNGTQRLPDNATVAPVTARSSRDLDAIDDLRRMAEQWDDLQPASVLSRIESQLESMSDLLRHLRSEPREDSSYGSEHCDGNQHRYERLEEPTQTDPASADPAESWNAIKQQILDQAAELPAEFEAEDRDFLRQVSDLPGPAEINFETATVAELQSAINQRDNYIIQLNRLVRMKNTFALPPDWAELGKVPDELQIRVETLLERLNVQVRLGEVEMSLERARIARERAQTLNDREQIDKHLRRLGLNSISELDSISAAPGSASDRRWMRFLGTPK